MTRSTPKLWSLPALLLLLLVVPACVDFAIPMDDEEILGAYLDGGREAMGDELGRLDELAYPETIDPMDPNYCPYATSGLPALTSSALVRASSFEPYGDLFGAIDFICETPGVGAELGWRLETPIGVELQVRLFAKWDAVLTLAHDGCRAGHVLTCAPERLDVVLGSARNWLFLESLDPELTGAFDLLIALNHRDGHEDCPVAGEIRLSSVSGWPLQGAEGGSCYRQMVIRDDTRAARDDVYLPCAASADPLGGAPDHIWRLVSDDAPASRRVSLSLAPEGWDATLAVTAAPCGATSRLIDCDDDVSSSEEIADLVLFPGDPVYVIVDGAGEALLDGRAAGVYDLVVRVDEACP
jgi:hypothetical protein